MSHHEILAAIYRGVAVLLFEHTTTERGYLKQVLAPQLTSLLRETREEHKQDQVLISEEDKEPLVYF